MIISAMFALGLATQSFAYENRRDFTRFDSPYLSVSVSPNVVTLLDSSGTTCAGSPISGHRLTLGSLNLNWKGSSPLREVAIAIAFQDANLQNGQYSCVIDGGEFDAIFGTQNSEILQRTRSICNLQCGGISLLDTSRSVDVSGTLTVFGVTQMGSAGRVQQQSTIPIRIQYR